MEKQSNTSDVLLTRNQMAQKLNVSTATLDRWIRQGKITAYKISTRIRFKPGEAERALKNFTSNEIAV